MPDYQRGKIYKIVSGDLTYLGSTTQPTLAKRLAEHVSCFKRWKEGKRHFITSFPLIESSDYTISLIELCPCGSKDEMTARERFWIESMTCVNKSVPGRTKKEWEETNKDHTREQRKEFREANKEKIAEQKRVYREENKEYLAVKRKAYYQKIKGVMKSNTNI
jgi:hypothetical protein